MASGQDLRITDVPFSNLPATTATVFINDNGKLRQTDLTTVAKNSELHTLIVGAHQTALDDIHATHGMHTEEWERIHDHTLDDFQRASDQHIQALDDKLNTSSNELSQLIEAGHEKLQDDIKVVDELCAYAATVRETTFEKNAQLMPTVPGNVIIGSIKGDSYQKQETRISRNLAKVNEFTADNTVYTLNLSEELKLNTLYHIQADVEVQVGELNGIHVSFGDASTTFPIVDGRISAIWDTSILSSTRDYLIFFPNDIPVGSGGKTVKFSNVMLTESDTEVAYEPYFEPQVSPSPTFPQEIESVGDSGWFDDKLVQGSFNMGAETTSTTRLRSDFIPINTGDKIEITVKNALAFELFLYDENKSYLNGMAMNASIFTNTISKGSYMRFSIRYEDNTTITPNDDISVSVTINGQYATRIKTVGKNLLRNTASSGTGTTSAGVTFTVNEDGSVTMNGTSTGNTLRLDFTSPVPQGELIASLSNDDTSARLIIGYFKEDGTAVNEVTRVAPTESTFTFPDDAAIMRVYLSTPTDTTYDNVTVYPMIRKADVIDATYEPYTSSTVTIPLTEPLRAIGDVKDEICVQDGKYGVLRKIGSVVLDGSESWRREDTVSNKGGRLIGYAIKSLAVAPNSSNNVAQICSDHYLTISAENTYYQKQGISLNTIAELCIWDDTHTEGIDTFIAWLASNPVTIDYELATPVFEPFADQTPFYELMAYDEVTSISIVCGDNLNPSATVMYPGTEAGALLTSAYVAGKVVKPSADVIVNLLDTAWELDEVTGMYTQTVTVKGITQNDTPVIGLLASDTPTSDTEAEAYAHLTDAVTGDGTLTLYADEALSIVINIVVKGISSGAEATVTVADIITMTTQYNEMKAKVAKLNNAFVVPDYKKANNDLTTYKNLTGQFTVSEDGYIIGYSRHDVVHRMVISINDLTVAFNRVEADVQTGAFTSLYPVKTGDSVEWSTSEAVYEGWVLFVPLRR